MNKASAEMRHCLNIPGIATEIEGMDISVLEKQRIAPKWQQHLLQVQPQYQQDNSSFNEASIQSLIPAQTETFQGLTVGCGLCLLPPSPNLEELLNEPIKTDPGVHSRWIDFNEPSIQSARQLNSLGYGLNHAISRTASCPPLVAAAATAAQGTGRQPLTLDQKLSGATGRENFKKRKAEKSLPPKGNTEEGNRSKKSKGCAEEDESKITEHISNRKGHSSQSNRRESGSNNNEKKYKEALGSTSKDNSKASEPNQPDYVHVRARRGQATDSHSLAERVRREKISERMKHLQDLVPGCNKITGKAGMLDEIINYVESLQRQVEFLSMKLAAVNPKLDFSIEDLIDKQAFATCSISMPAMGISPDCLQYNPIKQDLVYASELAVSQLDMGLRRAISAPISMPETFFDPSSFNQISGSLPWDANLQNIYAMECQQGRSIPSQLQTFTGTIEANSLKMGM